MFGCLNWGSWVVGATDTKEAAYSTQYSALQGERAGLFSEVMLKHPGTKKLGEKGFF